jgi:acetylornithine/succinyldiaminopimelate/putrescine aminotransferase
LLAQKLSSLTNGLLNAVYFVNSGAEAVEGSLKLARRYTGRKKIISFRNAYHGSTLGAMSLLTDDENYEAYGPFLQQVQHINFNKTDELSCIDTDTACVIVEPVQGEAGYIPATYEFLMALRKKCTDTGCLLIFDEIQSGMGRTGSFFAYQNYQVIPDVLLLAKALGGGLPLGAFLADKKIMDVFTHHPILGHMTTFGGNPLCCATSLAAIQVIEKENLLKDMDVKEKLFKELLTDTRIHEVRGIGLMIAVQLSSFEEVQKVIQYAFNKNVLLDWFLYNNSAIRIAPPLTISENQIREVCEVIIKGVSKI